MSRDRHHSPHPLKVQFVIPMLKHYMANQCTKIWRMSN